MSTYETLQLMLSVGSFVLKAFTFVVVLIKLDNHNDKK